jgi:hypothetical protein
VTALYLIFLPNGCTLRAVLNVVFFEINSLGLDAILVTKAYVATQNYFSHNTDAPTPCRSSWLAAWLPSHLSSRSWWIIIIGACLLLVKHGFAIATFSLFHTYSLLIHSACVILFYPNLFLVAVILDACASLLFSTVFLYALAAHVQRIQQSVQESRVLTIYNGLLHNDLWQLAMSAISAIALILVYTLVHAPYNLAPFYPLALSRKSAIITLIGLLLNACTTDAIAG